MENCGYTYKFTDLPQVTELLLKARVLKRNIRQYVRIGEVVRGVDVSELTKAKTS